MSRQLDIDRVDIGVGPDRSVSFSTSALSKKTKDSKHPKVVSVPLTGDLYVSADRNKPFTFNCATDFSFRVTDFVDPVAQGQPNSQPIGISPGAGLPVNSWPVEAVPRQTSSVWISNNGQLKLKFKAANTGEYKYELTIFVENGLPVPIDPRIIVD